MTRARVSFDAHIVLLVLTLIAFGGMAWTYFDKLKPVEIALKNRVITVHSNQNTVGGVLHDAAIRLAPEDITFPALDAPIPDNQPITIRFALPVQIQSDGVTLAHRTQSRTIVDALQEANVFLQPHDRVLLDGKPVDSKAPLLAKPLSDSEELPMPRFVVQRAVPIHIDDNGAQKTFYTTAPTLGEALRQLGFLVYLGDYVVPDLGTPVESDAQILIQRSRPVSISVDGRTIRTRTRGTVVAGVLAEEDVELKGKDYTIPPATTALKDDMSIRVMRVKEEFITEAEAIAFDTTWQADSNLDIDSEVVTQPGAEGTKKRLIRIYYENGREVRRTVDKEWVETPPTTQQINYGTRLLHKELVLPDGSTVTYWRKLRLHATSYTAATSGKARSHPAYGITATGLQAGTGVVAVDPRVINLRSKLYVPGYGVAIAGDTGGRIKGMRIDLGYDEWDLVLWYKWSDVYLLDPPPPRDQIRWIMPDVRVNGSTPK